MKTIDHGTDKRNIQELTKLSVKASIKEANKGVNKTLPNFPRLLQSRVYKEL